MDRAKLAKECQDVERAGGNVREFLKEKGFISPWGTWYRLQKEELHRNESQITDGKGDEGKLKKITLEQKKKAVQLAIDGGDVMEFLRSIGSKNPSGLWWTIKHDVKAADPELYAKIPKDGSPRHEEQKEAPQDEPEAVYAGVNTDGEHEPVDTATVEKMLIDAGLVKEAKKESAPEPASVEEVKKRLAASPVMVVPAGFMVTSIRGTFGEWHLDGKSLDFRGMDGEELCMRPDAWLRFADEIRDAMIVLGVKN